MKVFSIWDTKLSSETILEEGLILSGLELISSVRRLYVDSGPVGEWVLASSTRPASDRVGRFEKSKILRVCSFFKFKIRNIYLIIRNRPDLILCHFGQTGARYVRLANFLNIPLVSIFYGHDISAALKSKRWRRKYKAFIKFSNHSIVMCQEAKDRLQSFGCDASDITIWNLPVSFVGIKPKNRSAFSISNPLKVVTAGRFVEKKGYSSLFSLLRLAMDEGITLNLTAFGYGNGVETLKNEAELKGISNQIDWKIGLTGDQFRSEFGAALVDANYFLFGGETAENGDDEGGIPLSIVLAQASNTPLISSRFTGFEVSAIDGFSAFVCGIPFDLSALKIINSTKGQQELLSNIAMNGSNIARSEFDLTSQIEKLRKILEKVITLKTSYK